MHRNCVCRCNHPWHACTQHMQTASRCQRTVAMLACLLYTGDLCSVPDTCQALQVGGSGARRNQLPIRVQQGTDAKGCRDAHCWGFVLQPLAQLLKLALQQLVALLLSRTTQTHCSHQVYHMFTFSTDLLRSDLAAKQLSQGFTPCLHVNAYSVCSHCTPTSCWSWAATFTC